MEKLKAEIFDIIKEQDLMKINYQRLEQKKQEKLVELKKKEDNVKV